MKLNQPKSKQSRKWYNYQILPVLALTICSVLFSSCCKIVDNDELKSKVEYDNPYNWVSLPSVSKNVDVFYVYPTVSSNINGSMDITNTEERALAVGIFQAQASVFELNANVFAPYYRQMSTNVESSRQREFHPKPLTEPYVIVSHHTALVIQIYEIKLNSQPANGKTNMEIVPLFV